MGWRETLRAGGVIPAHPLALTAERKLDERRQRALTRYYLAAGAKGLAVGVHTTQFEIHEPSCGLLQPVLALAAAECQAPDVVKIAGVCGDTRQAVKEAEMAAGLGYHAMLVSLRDLPEASVDELLDHVRAVAAVAPVMGFYLQPAVSGRPLPYEFWRAMAQIEGVVGIKIAPFNRYHTLAVVRGVIDSGRSSEIALYTGNDDNIVADLLTKFSMGGTSVRFVGGLLGQWAVWTNAAVRLLAEIQKADAPLELLTLGQQLTDANAAIFDVAHEFRGCIAGIHEILRRQGLLEGRWCLRADEELSPGQEMKIARVCAMYPHLTDDWFVREHLHEWMA